MKWLAIVLTALFTAAKLAHVVAWSWWLVLLPAIAYVGLVSLVTLVTLILLIILKDE